MRYRSLIIGLAVALVLGVPEAMFYYMPDPSIRATYMLCYLAGFMGSSAVILFCNWIRRLSRGNPN